MACLFKHGNFYHEVISIEAVLQVVCAQSKSTEICELE